MGTRNTSASAHIKAALVLPDGDTRGIDVNLRYAAADPFAITFMFNDCGNCITWTFSREIVKNGLVTHSGDGDVQLWPDLDELLEHSLVMLLLSGDEGHALIEIPFAPLDAFVATCYAMIGEGSELDAVDLDAELALLMK